MASQQSHGVVKTTVPSPLLSLPPELRNHIYELVLSVDGNVVFGKPVIVSDGSEASRFTTNVEPYLQRGRAELGLLMTCKQITQEVSQLYYSVNSFTVIATNHRGYTLNRPSKCIARLHDFISTIGWAHSNALSSVNICLGILPMVPSQPPLGLVIDLFRPLQAWHLANPSKGLKVTYLVETYPSWLGLGQHDTIVAVTLRFQRLQQDCKSARETVTKQVAQNFRLTQQEAEGHWNVKHCVGFLENLRKAF